jgi:hypothetical protein
MTDFIMEPKVGGRWYELDEDGTQCDTGRVLVYEPPEHLVDDHADYAGMG